MLLLIILIQDRIKLSLNTIDTFYLWSESATMKVWKFKLLLEIECIFEYWKIYSQKHQPWTCSYKSPSTSRERILLPIQGNSFNVPFRKERGYLFIIHHTNNYTGQPSLLYVTIFRYPWEPLWFSLIWIFKEFLFTFCWIFYNIYSR